MLPRTRLVSVHDLFHRFTMDSFTKIAFGKDLHVLEKYLAGDKQPVPFAAAFDEVDGVKNGKTIIRHEHHTTHFA